MKINLRESLNKIDLATDNKYDLLNTFNSIKLFDNSKKKLVEAIENNSIDSVNKILHESEEQLYKVVLSSGATKFNFESALYKDEAEGIVDYYDGRWIDENGFEWDMYVEEDDDSTEHAMVDDSYDIEDDDERMQRSMDAYDQSDRDWEYIPESLTEASDFAIRVFPRGSEEYFKLDKVASWLTYLSPNKIYYAVEQTYFDYGQDWKWTTIIAYRSENDSWQAINPRQQKNILLCTTDEELEEVAKDILRESRLDKGFNESLPSRYWEPEDDRTDEEEYQDWLDNGSAPNYDEEPPFESLNEDLSSVEEIKQLDFTNNRVNNLRGIFSTKSFVKALNDVGLDKFKIRTSRLKNISKGDLKDAWYDLKRNGWSMSIERDPSLSGFNEVYVFEKITNESLNEKLDFFDIVDYIPKEILNDEIVEGDIFTGFRFNSEESANKFANYLEKKGFIVDQSEVNDLYYKGYPYKVSVYDEIDGKYFDDDLETDESLTEASYGGAYDIEDDMFFTKEEIVELANKVCSLLQEKFGYDYKVVEIGMESTTNLYLCIQDINGIEEESTFRIDMIKIRKPSDLFKYAKPIASRLAEKFEKEYQYYNFDELLKESKLYGYNMLSSTLKDGGDTYALLRKTEDGKTKWAAAKYVNGVPDEDNVFEITYEQARGFEPLTDTGKMSRKLGKVLLPKRENLKEDTVKQNGKWVNKGKEGTHGKFKTKKAADQQRKAMYAQGFKGECLEESNDKDSEDEVAVFTKGIDGKSYYHGFMDRKEADKHYPDRLKEAIDDETDFDFETDFDDGEVEEGNVFFADDTDWVWEERIAGPLYLDFDKWAVWSARESVDIRDFIIGKNDNGGWDIDKEAYIEAVKSKPIVYFIVDEDTGFIDWGPVENEIEAKDFLNSKQDDWDNDNYYGESLKESFDYSTTFEIYYDDIDGEKADYYFEVPYIDVLEFLANYAEDEEDAPQDEEELLKYIDKNFDRLYNEYEYKVLDHFYEDAEMKYQSDMADRAEYIRDTMRDRDI